MVERGVILAAGRGTRLHPVTKTQPKEMVPVGRKPAIEYIVDELAQAGIMDVLIVTGKHKSSLEAYFDDSAMTLGYKAGGIRIYFVRQPQPLGTGDAIKRAIGWTNDKPFVVAMGDCIIWSPKGCNITHELIEVHERYCAAVTVAVELVKRSETNKYGIVCVKRHGHTMRVTGVIEKPSPEDAPSRLAIAGRYVFDPVVYEALNEVKTCEGKELGITDAIGLLINKGFPVYCVKLRDGQIRMDVGSFEGYFKAFIWAAINDNECSKAIRSFVQRVLKSNKLI
ncbi:MAG: sugar phosphate nucleotidyltransferase [Armatimonadota bacterium]|nr:sugar phosphate nucleotidyltransferase [Armatimonadota bacterium]MCX7776684.1 sugar phosphate nucleotidyltransferase [Armatimonadota bacterium]MDW8025701.1 sugar phosphate nucleotidyltransferase [Armatimonadota bacterium]